MNIKTILLQAFMLLTPVVASAYEVTATVTDSIGVPEPFATFRIVNMADTTHIITGVSNEDGVILKTIEDAGEYKMSVSAVGKQKAERSFEVSDEEPSADLGNIILLSMGFELGEVQVTAMRPIVTREIDRIGYDVQADSDSKTSQLDEMLGKVPLVTVDIDGTVRVKGSTDFKVYKNGRPDKAMSTNPKDIFKSIPASMISKIEVITDPGAREDSEGATTILNIVMMQNTITKGVIGNVSLRYDTNNDYPTPNLWLSGQVDKVSLSAYGGMYSSAYRSSKSRTVTDAEYKLSGNHLHREQTGRSKGKGGWFGMEGSWEIDTLNLLTVSADMWMNDWKSEQVQYSEMTDADGAMLYRYTLYPTSGPTRYYDLNGNISYQRLTRVKNESIVASYRVSASNQHNLDSTYIADAINAPMAYTGWSTYMDLDFIEHTAQLDWKRPFGKVHKLDVGAKAIFRRNHSDTRLQYTGVGNDTTNYTHNTLVAAVYADYRAQVGKWGFRAGARYEYSYLKSDYVDELHPEYSARLNDICPNVAVSYNISDGSTVKLSYSSSINRPGINYLNPAINIGPLTESHGNPDLKSARNNSFTFNFNYFSRKLMVDFSGGYTFVNNGIIENRTIDADNVTHTTYANNGFTSRINLNGYVRLNAGSKTTVSLNFGGSYNYFKNDNLKETNSGLNGYASLWVQQRLPWKLRVNGSVSINHFPVWGLYNYTDFSWSNQIYYNIGLQRSFLKEDRLTVGISSSRPIWKKYATTHSYTRNLPVVWDNYTWRRVYPSAQLTISYRFGSMNIQVKKTAAEISNDDMVGGTSRN